MYLLFSFCSLGIYGDVKMVDSTLARSNNIIKRLARKMASDKYLWIIIFLIIVVVLVIIIYQKYH